MTDYTNESPFDPKWEMTPEQIAAVFAPKNEEDNKEPEGAAVPELSAENNMVPVDMGDSQSRFHKLLLTQNYLALLTSIQARLNKLYEERDNSNAEIDKEFVDNVTGLKCIRANAMSLYKLALESKSDADVVSTKDTFIELAKDYH
nr:MAG TPA: hypothetical protein [Caudoviricetes sp.]